MSSARTIVVGAGVSGLACAFDLARAGADVRVLEAAPRLGGVVGTLEVDGFRFERGPNTIQASALEFRRLCADLGLLERLIVSSDQARERYLFHRGALHALPHSPVSLATTTLLSARGKLRLFSEPLRRFTPPSPPAPEPDLGAFFAERIGPEAARVFAGAFVRGVYAAELGELGAASAFPRLWELASKHGGLVRGLFASRKDEKPVLPGPKVPRMALLSFPRGLQELVDALAARLAGRVLTGKAIHSLERSDGSQARSADARGRSSACWRAITRDGEAFEAEHLVLAIPAPVALRLLAATAPRGVPLAHLAAIGHARVVLVHQGFEASELAGWRSGFGYLVPPRPPAERTHGGASAEPAVLGTIFVSNLFPGRAPDGARAVSSFYPGALVERLDPEELRLQAARDLSLALGLARAPRPRVTHVERWNDVIPRYGPGHAERMRELGLAVDRELPGLHLAGSYTAGVGVEQVIARGRAVAHALLAAAPRAEVGSAP